MPRRGSGHGAHPPVVAGRGETRQVVVFQARLAGRAGLPPLVPSRWAEPAGTTAAHHLEAEEYPTRLKRISHRESHFFKIPRKQNGGSEPSRGHQNICRFYISARPELRHAAALESEEPQECGGTTFRRLVLPLCTPLCRRCSGSCCTPLPSGCRGETEARNSGKSFRRRRLKTDKREQLSFRRAAEMPTSKAVLSPVTTDIQNKRRQLHSWHRAPVRPVGQTQWKPLISSTQVAP